MKATRITAAALAAMLLSACGGESSQQMQYIKTSVAYDTISDMYQNPDNYLGGLYHIVGKLYPSTDDDGEKFYSVYVTNGNGSEGIGIELDRTSFEGIEDYELITVEGTLDKAKGKHDGNTIEYLILRCTSVEKRQS